jgi:hypothetical protein
MSVDAVQCLSIRAPNAGRDPMRYSTTAGPPRPEPLRRCPIIRHSVAMTCFAVALFVATSCGAQAPPPLAAAPGVWPDAPQVVALLNTFSTEATGCAMEGAPRSYSKDNLWEYIDGEAERFLAYDYRWTVAATYHPANSKAKIDLQVFAFGSDLDAFGAFAQDRNDTTPPALIQSEGFWAGNQLHVWRGPFYVRAAPSSTDAALRVPCFRLVEALFAPLPAPPARPRDLALLPVGDLLPRTVQFVRHDVLGQASLHNAVMATYVEDLPPVRLPRARSTGRPDMPRTANIRLIVLVGASAPEAKQLFADLLAALAGSAHTTVVEELGDDAAYASTDRYGRILVMRVRNYAAAVIGFDRNRAAEGLLRLLGTNIRVMLNKPSSP